jgi:hypothetical protein
MAHSPAYAQYRTQLDATPAQGHPLSKKAFGGKAFWGTMPGDPDGTVPGDPDGTVPKKGFGVPSP